jgi:hypothetical protein
MLEHYFFLILGTLGEERNAAFSVGFEVQFDVADLDKQRQKILHAEADSNRFSQETGSSVSFEDSFIRVGRQVSHSIRQFFFLRSKGIKEF